MRRRQSARSVCLPLEPVLRVRGRDSLCSLRMVHTSGWAVCSWERTEEVRATLVAHGRAGRLLKPHPRGLGVEREAVRGCARTASEDDEGQWTVARRRLAA
jgi:hypothetical protein